VVVKGTVAAKTRPRWQCNTGRSSSEYGSSATAKRAGRVLGDQVGGGLVVVAEGPSDDGSGGLRV
jgi:hypothetical protein